MLLEGDCVSVMATLPPESVDAVVTDPPYQIGFMSKGWDARSDHRPWAEAAYRVAKPSAYLLAFGGTRTVHRMTVALEDAGWIIRDMLVWAYASGFPKSKASLKPAWEPIVLARKPGPLRELAIDACRIPAEPYSYPNGPKGNVDPTSYNYGRREEPVDGHPAGRWPSNVVLTSPIFDGGVEGVVGGGEAVVNARGPHRGPMGYQQSEGYDDPDGIRGYDSHGTYSRFFLIAKSSRADREPAITPEGHDRGKRFSTHPTVKPTELMQHLVRLVTPPRVVVLECACAADNVWTVRGNGLPPQDPALLLSGVSGSLTEAMAGLPEVRGTVPSTRELARQDPEVLLQGVRGSGSRSPAETVRVVQDAVPAGHASHPVLFEEMRHEGVRQDEAGLDAEPSGVHLGVEPDASERDAGGLRHAAPPDHGGRDGAAPDGGRGGRPHQRDQGRQPTGEPAGPDQEGARRHIEPRASSDGVVPRVRAPLPAQGTCRQCGSDLAPGERPGLVLDPFSGSGSTLLAAEREGFRWLGIEKEAEYVAIAEARLNGTQRGLGLAI